VAGPGLWEVALAPGIPLSVDVQTGASDAALDLSGLTVPTLELHTGASHSRLTLPARGHTSVRIEAGAASVNVQVPDGVAARIRFRGGLANRSIDKARVPRSGDEFRSADYDTAENRADIDIQGGAGSFTVH
jgi:hypothetical protein